MTTRRPLLLIALALALAGCGDDADEAREPATTEAAATSTETGETEPPDTTEETTTAETATPRPYEIWLADRGFLRLGWRPGPGGEGVARAALETLLGETALTAVPPGTELLGVDIDGDAARVDLSSGFAAGGGKTLRLRVAQIVYTVTQFENVRSVEVLAEGRPVAGFDGPQERADFEDILAPVIVESPTGLEPVSSPLRVSGTANVFEANVTIRIVSYLGEGLAATFTTATCGTGCRGDFEASVPFSVSQQTRGTLIVSEDDASGGAEGHPPYTLEIPLLLEP